MRFVFYSSLQICHRHPDLIVGGSFSVHSLTAQLCARSEYPPLRNCNIKTLNAPIRVTPPRPDCLVCICSAMLARSFEDRPWWLAAGLCVMHKMHTLPPHHPPSHSPASPTTLFCDGRAEVAGRTTFGTFLLGGSREYAQRKQ